MIPSFEHRHSAGHRLVAESWGLVAGAGATIIGGMMTADAAGDASEGQQQASREANMLQRYMYDRNVDLQMPTIRTGDAARNRLTYLLGLSPTGFGGAGGRYEEPLTRDALRQQLVGQYTTYGRPAGAATFHAEGLPLMERMQYERIKDDPAARAAFEAQHLGAPTSVRGDQGPNPGQYDTYAWQSAQDVGTVNEEALNAEIDRRMAEQEARMRAAEEAARNDPNYGRLAREFEFGTYTPGSFSFSNEDFYRDPSYAFRLEQGQKALDRSALAAGRFLSGRQLQASSDYNQDAASQEYGNAWTRALNTFNVNETGRRNAFDTNEQNRFNAYQANFSNTINPLLSLSGAGQVGAQFLGGAGERMAQIVGNNTTGAANATGAAGIAGANAISSGLTGAANSYQQNQLLQRLMSGSSVNNNPGGVNTLWGSGGFFSGNRGSGD